MIGVRPTHAHTGLGYLRAGRPLRGFNGSRLFRLAAFIEKPSRAVAARLSKQPRTYWNNGIFVGTADKFLEVLAVWLPEHTRRLVPLASEVRGTGGWAARAQAAYRTLKPISFDRGVTDRLQEGVVVEGLFPWSDVGSVEVWTKLARKRDARAGA